MLSRQARLRREYLYRRANEERERKIAANKERIRKALDENDTIDSDLRKKALSLQEKLPWDGDGVDESTTHVDDEYRWAGVQDPKIMITTSRDPSSKLKQFAKELRLVFPNAQRMNRGNYEIKQLVQACQANEVTDFLIIHETRGKPDSLIVCHLPFGPTATFTLSSVVMRHDIPDIGTMSEAYPHLIFHNFKSNLGKRVVNILKHLFPVPKDDSKRMMTFANDQDYISFRHHIYKNINRQVELTEVGPRFEMKLYEIKLGTIDHGDAAEIEWKLKPFMNTMKKRQFLSDESKIN
ncbi:U3 small nucleolar ribonucleoprotein IMP4 [Nymphon striatum]|nr:U3 small nucleolar ribonucleoprotein IMP4 [Nymphon striatum]KAG1701188.1 U3 small nucleolar ribonucleoprotein IMP4 [Nymphon striatum]